MPRTNSSNSAVRTSTKALAGLIAAATLGLAFASPAGALGTVALSASPLVDSASNAYYLDNTAVTASASGLTASANFYVGICETATYPYGVPACSGFIPATSNATGQLSAVVTVQQTAANSHSAIPGQPSNIDCTSVGSCQVAIADHTGRVFVDTSAVFYVTP